MLYDLVQVLGEKETVFMTGDLVKVRARRKQLRSSQRGMKHTYVIRPAGENAGKYIRPPSMNFCPGGDSGTRKHRNKKKRSAKTKKNTGIRQGQTK